MWRTRAAMITPTTAMSHHTPSAAEPHEERTDTAMMMEIKPTCLSGSPEAADLLKIISDGDTRQRGLTNHSQV